MAIVQISKIQHRAGNIVDLPQLDEAELGFASDAKRLFIGKVSPNENIEVLTSYSDISFSQLDGAVGNLDISAISIADGQVLVYDGTNWVNRGGDAGGLIDLGDAANVRITGGAIGYVLETDGTGNLAWSPKSSLIAYIRNVTNANPAVVTTEDENIFTDGAQVTFTNVPGIAGSVGYVLNGQTLYANVLTSNTFSLYTDAALTTTYDASGNTAFPSTTATATSASNNRVTVTSSSAFTVGDSVQFTGTMFGILNTDTIYYVKTIPTATTITLSLTSGGTELTLTTATGSCTVNSTGGRVIASLGSAGTTLLASGSNTTVQFNSSGTLSGSSDFTWNTATSLLTVNGNANVGNLNATTLVNASRFTSTVATGTAPLTVTSTTRVSNLSVAYSNVSDFGVVTVQTTGSYFPVLVNGSGTANRALAANANLGFNIATGNLSATILYANSTITAAGNIVGANVDTAGTVTASKFTSNVATGTAPFTVASTTRVTNLNVSYANVSDFEVVTTQTTGTFYPTFVNANTTANYALGSNASLSFNAATGALAATLLTGTLTTAAQPNVTSLGTLTSLTVSGTVTANDIATYGTTGDALNITGAGNTNVNGAGGNINITAAQGNGTGAGGSLTFTSGDANSSGNAAGGLMSLLAGNAYGQGAGGDVGIYAGSSSNATTGALGGNIILSGGSYNQQGGNVVVSAGRATGLNGLGGDITIKAGPSTGSANASKIIFQTGTPGSSGNTVQVLSNRAIISDTNLSISMTTAASNTASGALIVSGGIGVGGNIYGSAFYGSATGLFSIPAGNVSGTVANATYATTAGTVSTAAQPNITSLGNLTALTVDSGTITSTSPILFKQTWSNANASFTTLRINAIDNNSSSTSYLLDLQSNSSSKLTVNKNGTLQVLDITTGANTTAGNITGNWSLTAGSRLNATYADLAEYYEADVNYEAGTVVEFGGEKEITIATDGTRRVAGVVSTNPAYVMNSSCPGIALAIALQGRVPVKVRGTVRKGDLLISAGNGFARPSNSPIIGSIIGKALQNFDGVEGTIEVAIGRL